MLIPCPIDIGGGKRNRARYDRVRERVRETFEFFFQSFPSSQKGQKKGQGTKRLIGCETANIRAQDCIYNGGKRGKTCSSGRLI